MHTEADTVVFLGPTLPIEQAAAILPARYEPPARLGSVYELIGSDVATILLIDGLFHNQPSIWQREVDAALAAGMTVFGASSMGALRAAELHRLGMIGHGTVFEWYRDGLIDGDDEVAVLHADAAHGYAPASEPLVNIRYTLQCAAEDGVLPRDRVAAVVQLVKKTYYPDRSYDRLVADLRADEALHALADPIDRYVRQRHVDVKRRDAISLLETVAELRRCGTPRHSPPPRPTRLRHGHARLVDAWRRHGQAYRALEHEGNQWTLGQVRALLERDKGTVAVPNLGGTGSITLSSEDRRALRADRATRDVAIEYIRARGFVGPEREVGTVTRRLQRAIAATSPNGTITSWMRACRMTRLELEDRLATEATLAWLATNLPPGVDQATAGWLDPLADVPAPEPYLGLYLRVFASHTERLAARRVALAALLDERDHDFVPVPSAGWAGLLGGLEARP